MKTKTYKLRFLPLFEDDLNEITDYIANHLQNPSAALRLIDDIETCSPVFLCLGFVQATTYKSDKY